MPTAKSITFVSLIMLIMTIAWPVDAVTVIRLHPKAEITEDAKIRDIVSNIDELPIIKPHLDLVVAAMPPLNGVRTVTARQVESLLRQRGVTGIRVEGGYTQITQKKQTLSTEVVAEFLRRDLASLLNKDVESVSVEVSGGSRTLPVGEIHLHAEWVGQVDKGGVQLVRMKASVGDTVTEWSTSAKILFRKDVPVVAVEPIRRGEEIRPETLTLMTAWVEDEKKYPEIDEIKGYVASTYLPVGRIVSRSDIEIPPMVVPGQSVSILYIGTDVIVEAAGVVLEKGFFGDQVRVNNAETKQTIKAQVVSPSLLTIVEAN